MTRYMSHPQHGFMPIYSQSEHDQNALHGWVECKLEDMKKPKAVEEKPVEAKPATVWPASPKPISELTDAGLASMYEEKFGKLPHHRMLRENIEAALKG